MVFSGFSTEMTELLVPFSGSTGPSPIIGICGLPQRFKQLVSLCVLRVTLSNNFDFHGLERFLGGDTIEPTLKRKLFVVGEIEANEHANVRGVLFVRFGVLPTFCG